MLPCWWWENAINWNATCLPVMKTFARIAWKMQTCCQICSTMYGNVDEDMFQKFLETDQFSCSFPVKREFLWRAQWAEKLVYLQSVKSACAFLPSCGFSGNCPRFFKVFTGRETILTFLLLLKCLCVRAKTTFSRKFPDTCGGKQNLLWLFRMQSAQIQTTNIRDGVKTEIHGNLPLCSSTFSHLWQTNSRFHFFMPCLHLHLHLSRTISDTNIIYFVC